MSQPCQDAGRVEDLMTPDPVSVPPDTSVADVWATMHDRRFRHMPVADESGALLGIVSQRDLIGAGATHQGPGEVDAQRPVSEVMHSAVDTVSPECCAAEAARHMLRSKRSCLPVVDGERKLVGILTEADYLRLATRGAPPCSCGGVSAAG